MMRDDESRCRSSFAASLARDRAQRLAVQVIEMRVGYEHNVHRRQVAEIESGLPQALKNEKPACEVGIDDDILSANLEKEAGMTDEGEAELSLGDEFGFVSFAGTRGDHGMPYEVSKLARALS
jgi:hypothetical protein